MLKQATMWATFAAGLVVAGGCAMQCPVQRVQSAPPEVESQTPVLVDEAMRLRQWDRSVAGYGNGNVVAGPTGFMYQPSDDMPAWVYVIEETPLFVVQAVTIPIPLIITPPWTPVMYSGVTVPPSYTALPPVPGRPTTPVPTTQP